MPKVIREGILELGPAEPKDLPKPLPSAELLLEQNKNLANLLNQMLITNGVITANGNHAKNRCYDCANRYNHDMSMITCPCVCHEARRYLTSLAE